jgi:adenylosuccinate lyase
MKSWETGCCFRSLLEADPRVIKKLKAADLDKAFDLQVHLKDVDRTFKAVGL